MTIRPATRFEKEVLALTWGSKDLPEMMFVACESTVKCGYGCARKEGDHLYLHNFECDGSSAYTALVFAFRKIGLPMEFEIEVTPDNNHLSFWEKNPRVKEIESRNVSGNPSRRFRYGSNDIEQRTSSSRL